MTAIVAPTVAPPSGARRLLLERPTARHVDHVARLGYLPRTGPALIDEVERASLRGRGGAGFPTAVKMVGEKSGIETLLTGLRASGRKVRGVIDVRVGVVPAVSPGSPPGRVTILVVDDEAPIRRVVKSAVSAHATRFDEAATGQEGIDLAAAEKPNLIVLDLGLPDMSGADVCRAIRGWSTAPIVVLSARHSDDEKVELLNSGADDYVTKPFSTSEFQARVGAHLRRVALAKNDTGSPRIELDGLVIDLTQRSVTAHAKRIHLTPIEWELLRVLATNPGRTLTHAQLFSQVWKRAEGDAQQYLRVHVASLRRKLEDDAARPRYILTEQGIGYRFAAE